jgi:hypothetical protein
MGSVRRLAGITLKGRRSFRSSIDPSAGQSHQPVGVLTLTLITQVPSRKPLSRNNLSRKPHLR